MEDTLNVNLDGIECDDFSEEMRNKQLSGVPSQYDVRAETTDVPAAVVLTGRGRGEKQQRKYKSSSVTGLTEREYQVLRIVNTHGWCTSEMVRQIAQLHGVSWTTSARRSHQLLRSLEQSDMVVSRRVVGGTRTRACAVTERGMRYILAEGDALVCDTNAIKDPASVYHFLGLNKIMLAFRSQFSAKFWLTDFEVRSDNSFIGRDGLAKDYDSVAELALPGGGRVRFGIEYERSPQSASRHEKLSAILQTEQRLQFVLFVLNDPRLRNTLMAHLKKLAGFAYFIEYDRFLQSGLETPVYYWTDGKLYQAPLSTVLKHASRKSMLDYVPVHQLDLRVHK